MSQKSYEYIVVICTHAENLLGNRKLKPDK